MKTNDTTGLKRAYRENDAAPEWQKVADKSGSGEAASQERRKLQQIADDAVKKALTKK